MTGKLNWQKGMFRAWLVASLVWSAGVLVAYRNEFAQVTAPVSFYIYDQTIEVPANTPSNQVRATLSSWIKTARARWLKEHGDPLAKWGEEIKQEREDRNVPSWYADADAMMARGPTEAASKKEWSQVRFPDNMLGDGIPSPDGIALDDYPRIADFLMMDKGYVPKNMLPVAYQVGLRALGFPSALLVSWFIAAWIAAGFRREYGGSHL